MRGAGRQRGNSIWYCVNGTPKKETLDNIAYTCMLSILSKSFTSVSIFSVCCYSSVSISVLIPPPQSAVGSQGWWEHLQSAAARGSGPPRGSHAQEIRPFRLQLHAPHYPGTNHVS